MLQRDNCSTTGESLYAVHLGFDFVHVARQRLPVYRLGRLLHRNH
jgi:hypothetical protein